MVPFVLSLILAIFAATGGGVAYASQASLPGDTLYPVKTAIEQVQVALATSGEAKTQAYLELAQRRLDELAKLAERGKNSNSQELVQQYEQNLTNAVESLEQSEQTGKNVDDLINRFQQNLEKQQSVLEKVQQQVPDQAKEAIAHAMDMSKKGMAKATEAAERREEQRDNATSTASPSASPRARPSPSGTPGQNAPVPSATEPRERKEWKVEGILQSFNSNTWVVDGRTFVVDSHTSFEGRPPVIGAHVTANGVVQDNGSLLALKVEVGGGIPGKPDSPRSDESREPTETPGLTSTRRSSESPTPTYTPRPNVTAEPRETSESDETPEATGTPRPGTPETRETPKPAETRGPTETRQPTETPRPKRTPGTDRD